jgi:hypothetical protein
MVTIQKKNGWNEQDIPATIQKKEPPFNDPILLAAEPLEEDSPANTADVFCGGMAPTASKKEDNSVSKNKHFTASFLFLCNIEFVGHT